MTLRRAIALLFVLTTLMASPAWAQGVSRTVILNVSDGGDTSLLVAEVEALPKLDIKDQKWFLEQVKSRGMSPKKLLQRPADLRFVMSGSDIKYVLYVDRDDAGFVGQIFSSDGQMADSVGLGDEFGQVEAAMFRETFEGVLGIKTETVQPIEVVRDAKAPAPPVEEPPPAAAPARGDRSGGLAVAVAGRMFKRDLTYAGGNNAVLNYQSALYPGAALDGEYVLGVTVGPGLLGLWLGIDAGFDSLATPDESFSILHLEAAGGVSLNFDTVSLRLGGRHIRYSLPSNDTFPTIVHTVAVLGLGAEEHFGSLALGGDVEIHPWGLYHGSSSRLFGAKSSEIGFGSGVRLGYLVGESFKVTLGYGARVQRSRFPGAGSLDFSDSRGFELVHGPELGVTWHP